jgi:opacity protein-like surface antigen
MNGRKSFLVAAALFAFVFPVTLSAQSLYISGGATFPTGDFGDYADTGWMIAGGVLFNDIGTGGLSLGAEGFYGENKHGNNDFDYGDGKTNPYCVMGIAVYSFQTGGSIQPYVFGGAGWLAHKFTASALEIDISETTSSFGYQFGAGVGFPISQKVSIYGEGRYMGGTGDNSDTKFFGAFAGLTFGLGS